MRRGAHQAPLAVRGLAAAQPEGGAWLPGKKRDWALQGRNQLVKKGQNPQNSGINKPTNICLFSINQNNLEQTNKQAQCRCDGFDLPSPLVSQATAAGDDAGGRSKVHIN